ncbi:hypothetical protein HDV05_002296, partial [Chytridiales sp. JEL 0842]
MDLVVSLSGIHLAREGNYFAKVEVAFAAQAEPAQRTEVAVPATADPVFDQSTFTFTIPSALAKRLDQRQQDVARHHDGSVVDGVDITVTVFSVERQPDGSAAVNKVGSTVVRVSDLMKVLSATDTEPTRKIVVLKANDSTEDALANVGQLELGLSIVANSNNEPEKDSLSTVTNGFFFGEDADYDSYGRLMLTRSLIDLERPIELEENTLDEPVRMPSAEMNDPSRNSSSENPADLTWHSTAEDTSGLSNNLKAARDAKY